MKPLRDDVSWKFLDKYRGKIFIGEWPTLPEMVHISQDRFPDNACFVDFDGAGGAKQSYTYTEVWREIETLAQWMMANGIKKGDRVAVSGKNSPEWAVVFIASMLAGAIACPMDYALHEKEIENLMKTAKPKMFFVDSEKYEYFNKHKNGAKIYSLNKSEPKTFVYNLKSTKKEMPFPDVECEDTAAILFTSGTTGIPKGVMLSHKNLVSDCFIAQQNIILLDTDVFYNLLPIHHGYTMQAALICPLSAGCSIVFGKSMAVTKLLKELREGKITLMLGVPLLYNKLYSGIMKGIAAKGKFVEGIIKCLMNISYGVKKAFGVNIGKHLLHSVLDAANISTIRVAICGGGPLAASIFKGYNALGIDFIQGYGLTETSPIIALNPKEHFKIESVGMDFSPYEEIKILNPNEDGIGEIAVKGPMVMQGYYKMPEETAKVFTEDGFFKTGDLGHLDDEHYLMLNGRSKNLIVTEGGKNVYPEEIEDAFQLYYDVEQIMVRGFIANAETKSEAIEALIYPADDLFKRLGVERAEATADDKVKVYNEIKAVVDKVNKTLQPYARISKITILDKMLEMTTTRKIKRNSVRESLESIAGSAKAGAARIKEDAKEVGEKLKNDVAPKVKEEAKKAAASAKKTASEAAAKTGAAVKKGAAATSAAVKKGAASAEKKLKEDVAPKVKAGAKKAGEKIKSDIAPKVKAGAKKASAAAKVKAETAKESVKKTAAAVKKNAGEKVEKAKKDAVKRAAANAKKK